MVITKLSFTFVAMRVRINEIVPLEGPLRSHIIITISFHATSTDSDVFVDCVIGAMNRNAPELALANTRNYMSTFTNIRSNLQTFRIILGVARVAPELTWNSSLLRLFDFHQNSV